ncbi:hypothetical protein [Nitrincola nitratireducens]|uniref:Uncharacterized protein n=1 Tax=Nitrincola nitratireducens TaxID=1229521 RepID=W9V7M1_9GAMM|nr:hypothetical protein [Nitrincola nitratireducens]EXJ12097.1 hypothetical protein D791_00986 [Nitrincola nitratireducens]
MSIEKIQANIETYTSILPQAVRSPNSASFGFLLSLIASNQERVFQPVPAASQGEFALASESKKYPHPDTLFTHEIVGRLNHSINHHERGEYAYLVSHLDVRSRMPESGSAVNNDRFAQLGLASLGGQMLAQIEDSRKSDFPSFSAVA